MPNVTLLRQCEEYYMYPIDELTHLIMKTTLERAKQKTNKNNISVLQSIIKKNYDARKGYKRAMVEAKDPALKIFLQQQARQRSNFTTAIDQEIRNLGNTPKEGGSIAGTLHRAWIDIKTLVAGNDDEIVLKEVIRGEKAKVSEYKGVMKQNTLAPQINSMLRSQLSDIKSTLNHVKALEGVT